MGIGGITSVNNMSVIQMPSTDLKDHKSKNIQNEITDVQQKIQKLSSENELSVNEKENERKKLQKEKSGLDNELKQHQEELLRSQKREAMLAELREAQNPSKDEDEDTIQTAQSPANTEEKENPTADERQSQPLQPGTVISENSDGKVILKEVMNQSEDNTSAAETKPAEETKETATAAEAAEPEEEETDTDPAAEFRPTANEMQALVSADTSSKMADRMGMLVTKTNDGIAILKGEIKQDSYYGTDTEQKEAELKDMQKQQKREMAVKFSMLGEAGNAMKAAFDTESADSAAPNDTGKHFQVSGLNVPQDEQAAQQGFQVSIA